LAGSRSRKVTRRTPYDRPGVSPSESIDKSTRITVRNRENPRRPNTSSMATEGGLAPDAAAGAGAGTDGIVGGPRTPQQIASQKRLQATQAQVDEVVDIMKTNVEKVLERDQKLSELDDRADALQQGASQFEQQAGKLKRKFWLQNLKMMIIIGVIALIVLAIIVGKCFTDALMFDSCQHCHYTCLNVLCHLVDVHLVPISSD
ncbi:Uncharacterized protein DBV15_08666, partial [Temnothorax longispinosus]